MPDQVKYNSDDSLMSYVNWSGRQDGSNKNCLTSQKVLNLSLIFFICNMRSLDNVIPIVSSNTK